MESVIGKISQKVTSEQLSFVTKENAQKVAKLLKVPVAHVGTNDNFFTFTEEELSKAAESMSNKPIYINLLGQAPDDHADNSSMNTIGWSDEAWYDPTDKTLYSNGEITEPTAVGKLERMDSKGRRELRFVSMSCDAVPICSVCGEDIRDCPHERGEEYDGEVCTAVGQEVAFQNYVLTNNPADTKAEIGEVIIENASLNKRWKKMPKVTKKRKTLRANQKAQETVVEETLPENEVKETESMEDMLMAIQTQLNSWEDKFTDMENRLGVLETPEVVEESPVEEAPIEEEVLEEEVVPLEEEELNEEEAQAGDAPIENPPPAEMPPKEIAPPESLPIEETPAATTGDELPTDVPQVSDGEIPTEETDLPPIPDGTEIVHAPAPVGEEPQLKKLKIEKEYSARGAKFKLKEQAKLKRASNENLQLKKENARLRAKEARSKMKEFAKKKMELIRKGFKEQAAKANTVGELNIALEVANKSNYSARQEKYNGSVPKHVDSRGAKTIEEAGNKVEIDFSKKGGVYAALEKAAKLSKKK